MLLILALSACPIVWFYAKNRPLFSCPAHDLPLSKKKNNHARVMHAIKLKKLQTILINLRVSYVPHSTDIQTR